MTFADSPEIMKKTLFAQAFAVVVLMAGGEVAAQSLLAAASQSMKLPADVESVAIWPIELGGGELDEALLSQVSDEIEQALSRKARETRRKVLTRRQLQGVVRELKLTSAEKTSFDQLARSTGAAAVVLPTGTVSKSGCLTVSIRALATGGESTGEVLAAARPFKVNTRNGELDWSGCD